VKSLPVTGGTATSIGSLPHTDPAAAAAFVLEAQPRLPAAPSLPNRTRHETMLGQAAWGVEGVEVDACGTVVVARPRALDPEAPLGDEPCAGDAFAGFRAFLDAVTAARRIGPIKIQMTGPVTFGVALHRAGVGRDRAFAVAASAVHRRASALVSAARAASPDTALVVFFDEPSLAGLRHPTFPLGAEEAADVLSGALAGLERSVMTGVHCCGRTDWRPVFAAGPHIVSMPVAAADAVRADDLGAFLDRGGWVAWGAVPTDGPLGDGLDRLWRDLAARWCEFVRAGCDGSRLRAQSLVTPACGLAAHGESQAARVLALTDRVAERLQADAVGVRLTVGA
jgi:hypothetical protein